MKHLSKTELQTLYLPAFDAIPLSQPESGQIRPNHIETGTILGTPTGRGGPTHLLPPLGYRGPHMPDILPQIAQLPNLTQNKKGRPNGSPFS